MALAKDTPAPAAAEKKSAATDFVEVTNLSKFEHYQATTGLRIAPGETKALRNDGWLELQIQAKLMKLA